jgi:biopolymer transport protein TolR
VGASLGRSGRRANSEINVTPFVDVMLVLLVIFMVTAPLMQQGMDVNLPQTTTQALRVKDSPLILSVDKAGKFYLGRKAVEESELEERLTAVFEARGSKEIFLRADKKAPYGVVVKAMAAARAAGSTKLGIVTEAAP